MTETRSYALSYLRRFGGDGPELSLIPAHHLSRDEHDEVSAAYGRLRQANHQPMIEMLEQIAVGYQASMSHALQIRRAGGDWEPGELLRSARVTAFGAVNAVYSFQEHTRADLTRLGGEPAWTFGNSIFSKVYRENPYYLLAYKLRRLFTHDTISSLDVRSDSRMIDRRMPSLISVACTFDRAKLIPTLGGEVKAWLLGLSEDPTLDMLLAKSWEGMSEVYGTLRSLQFPDEEDDLELLQRFRVDLMNPNYPLTLAELSFADDGRPGPMRLGELDSTELARAGMEPLSADELDKSTAAALSRIQDAHSEARGSTDNPGGKVESA
ncbi:hypothetical protein ACNKF0_19265 [Nocardioides sp. T5]|uniref:hypothetical protein n=1 Tax=Nocardioides sp. T5 TaxID=3400182 RepID=UPI003A8A4DE0